MKGERTDGERKNKRKGKGNVYEKRTATHSHLFHPTDRRFRRLARGPLCSYPVFIYRVRQLQARSRLMVKGIPH